jgi:hypothetical protein
MEAGSMCVNGSRRGAVTVDREVCQPDEEDYLLRIFKATFLFTQLHNLPTDSNFRYWSTGGLFFYTPATPYYKSHTARHSLTTLTIAKNMSLNSVAQALRPVNVVVWGEEEMSYLGAVTLLNVCLLLSLLEYLLTNIT